MTEDFLHYIWQFRNFDNSGLKAQTGESIEIIKPGDHNLNAGPDFFNSVLKIGETLWAGNVEIHINSSDWNKHNHSEDKAYNNVVLHVVYNDDCIIQRISGETIPAIELKGRINPAVFSCYSELLKSTQWISCSKNINDVDEFIVSNWLSRLLIERLERKAETIINSLKLTNNNWQETFYHHLARNFGFQLNAEPFELMSKSLPLLYLIKHRDNLVQIEAMIFGQAGMLESIIEDEYSCHLQKEYNYLKYKYSLNPIDNHLWKFLRLRPVSFPTIRLSQFANLICKWENLFVKILECNNLQQYYDLFNVSSSDYWDTHFTFGKQSIFSKKALGKSSVEGILINTVVPFLFVYGIQKQEDKFKEKALELLETLQGEGNSIIREWKKTGMKCDSAFRSQALLELKLNYCDLKRCLKCSIGNSILKRGI
ncbi:MAG: DUF2851 family protein [Bacteroidetes bacterium]|nr:DUF2851 family protein [Bacteroidota bacterium]HET6245838.1 DUF2851 family protein [Bacteroidia bacterium]